MSEQTHTTTRWRRPACDVFESASGMEIYADVPGSRRQDLSITLEADALLLETHLPEDGVAGRVPHYRRRFRISPTIDVSAISAKLEDGVLHVTLPVSANASRRTIDIEE